jgi:hypothetical protein
LAEHERKRERRGEGREMRQAEHDGHTHREQHRGRECLARHPRRARIDEHVHRAQRPAGFEEHAEQACGDQAEPASISVRERWPLRAESAVNTISPAPAPPQNEIAGGARVPVRLLPGIRPVGHAFRSFTAASQT